MQLRERVRRDRELIAVKIGEGVGSTEVQDVSVGQEDTQVEGVIGTETDRLSHSSVGECQEGDTLQKGNGHFEECTIRCRTVIDNWVIVCDTFLRIQRDVLMGVVLNGTSV